jgi:phosphocarrier protein FPr
MLHIETGNIRIGAQAQTKDQAIAQVAQILAENGYIKPDYAQSMLARERVANTYLGKGIAIPHGLPKHRDMILRTGIAVLQLPDGVLWQPGDTVRLVVGIAAKSDEHLEILGNLTDLLSNDELLADMATTRDKEQIIAVLGSSREEAELPDSDEAPSDYENCIEVNFVGEHGLHARPATAIVETVKQFDADVLVRCGVRWSNGKSMASLLKLGVKSGTKLTVSARGSEATELLTALKALIQTPEQIETTLAGPSHGWKPRASVKTIRGICASPGLAIGPVRLLAKQKIVVERVGQHPVHELERLSDAIATARAELEQLHEEVKQTSGDANAAIFLAHMEFLQDVEILAATQAMIHDGASAGWAWQRAIEKEVAALKQVDDALLAERAGDLDDVGTRVLRQLAGVVEERSEAPDEPYILLADELTTSDAAALDPNRVVGFCTAGGGPTSHTAIIARSLSIPAVVGAGPAIMHVEDGAMAIVDGDHGVIYINPGEDDLKSAQGVQQQLADRRADEARQRFEPALTRDGTRIEVVANIGSADDALAAVEAGGEGVGLMRSEFLFLERDKAPDEQEQYTNYTKAITALQRLPLTIRTLDIGGDKQVPYLDLPSEDNPYLGVRGIRLCLAKPQLLKEQLTAIYRASFFGPVRIMFPMVSSVSELVDAKLIAQQVQQEQRAPEVPIGIMIEVPAAVMMAQELAEHADFFSIGTNDLTQYVLAMDRGHPTLARQADALHPAVLRMIERTVRAADDKGIEVGVCGGMAGEPLGATLLVGMGVRELSVSIPSIAAIKAYLRGLTLAQAQTLARQALACDSAEAVRRLGQTGKEIQS